jgi:hypothetical protein
MVDPVLIRAAPDATRRVAVAAVFMLFGALLFFLIRNEDGGGLIGRLGPTTTIAVAALCLLLGAYFVMLSLAARRDHGVLVRADADVVTVQTVLRRRDFRPEQITEFRVVNSGGRASLAAVQDGRIAAKAIMVADGMTWDEAARLLNHWLAGVNKKTTGGVAGG